MLGKGGFAHVYKAYNKKTGKEVGMKMVSNYPPNDNYRKDSFKGHLINVNCILYGTNCDSTEIQLSSTMLLGQVSPGTIFTITVY